MLNQVGAPVTTNISLKKNKEKCSLLQQVSTIIKTLNLSFQCPIQKAKNTEITVSNAQKSSVILRNEIMKRPGNDKALEMKANYI